MKILTVSKFLLACFALTNALAQSDTLYTHPSKYLFSKNHFSFSIENGLTRGAIFPESGPLKPVNNLAGVHFVNFDYAFNFNRTCALSLALGGGFFPFYFRATDEDWYLFRYWDNLDGTTFLHLSAEVNHRFSFSEKKFLNIFAGVNVFKFDDIYTELSYRHNTGFAATTIFASEIVYTFTDTWRPAFTIGIGTSRILRNYDLLSLTLSYNHSFDNFLSGTYFITEPLKPTYSWGNLINKGNFLSVGIKYTFTKAQKQSTLAKIKNETGEKDMEKVEKIYKRQKRKPLPLYSTFVSASGGLILQPIHVSDVNNINISANSLLGTGYLSIEQNIKKNKFLETGYSVLEYYMGSKRKELEGDCFMCGSFTYAFDVHHFSLGIGKRLIGKNNYNYLNLHAGVVLSYTNQDKGLSGWGHLSVGDVANGDTVYFEQYQDYQKINFFPLFYVGISRDFRIKGNLYFNILYRYHQGIMNVSEREVQYVSQWTNGWQNAHIVINGSYHTFQAGFKYNFGNIFKIKTPNPEDEPRLDYFNK